MDLIIKLLIIIVVHELGHYIVFRTFGVNPKIQLKWYGILLKLERKDHKKLTYFKFMLIAYSGIFLGYIPLIIFLNESYWVFIYILSCFIDINAIIQGFQFNKKELLEMNLQELIIYKNLEEIQKYKLGD